jgi:hypothetical protein
MELQFHMDDGFPGECACGGIDFERVVMQRLPAAPITTDFVACVACRAMYFVPLQPIGVTAQDPRHGHAIGPPPPPRT